MPDLKKEYVIRRYADGWTRVYVFPVKGNAMTTFQPTENYSDKEIGLRIWQYEDDIPAIRTVVKALLVHEFVDRINVMPDGYVVAVLKSGSSMDFDGEKLDESIVKSAEESTEFSFRFADLEDY